MVTLDFGNLLSLLSRYHHLLYLYETTSGVAACLNSASDGPIVDLGRLQKANFVVNLNVTLSRLMN